MQLPPGDAYSRNVTGSVAQPRHSPRPAPKAPPQPQPQAPSAPPARLTASATTSPPPVDRAHSVERIAQGTIPRDVPRGSILDIQV